MNFFSLKKKNATCVKKKVGTALTEEAYIDFEMAQLCSHTSSCHSPSPDAYECMLYGHLMYYSFNLRQC